MKKKLVSLIAVLALVLSLIPTNLASAATSASSEAGVENYSVEDVNLNGNNDCKVEALRGVSYLVTIPKLIRLAGNTKSADYNVNVTGDIAGNQSVIVSPNSTFMMNEAGGKASVTAVVNQPVINFIYGTEVTVNGNTISGMNLSGGANISGNVTAPLTAGTWNGHFDFNLSLDGIIGEDLQETVNTVMTAVNTRASELVSVDGTASAYDTEEEVHDYLEAEYNSIASGYGATATVNCTYTAPVNGDYTNPSGTNGSYEYTVTISKKGTVLSSEEKVLILTPSAYNTSDDETMLAQLITAAEEKDNSLIVTANQTAVINELSTGSFSAVVNQVGYTAPVNGTATSLSGAAGSYSYTVTFTYGTVSGTTSTITRVISAIPYDTTNDTTNLNSLITTAQAKNGVAIASNSSAAVLSELTLGNFSAVVNHVGNTAPVNGTADNPSGVAGSYSYTVTFTYGTVSGTTSTITRVLSATPYDTTADRAALATLISAAQAKNEVTIASNSSVAVLSELTLGNFAGVVTQKSYTAPTCTAAGSYGYTITFTYGTVSGTTSTITRPMAVLGHVDTNGDYYCDRCGIDLCDGGSFTLTSSNLSIAGLAKTGNVVIPSTFINSSDGKRYRITSIGEKAFSNCTSLTGITIPSSVTSIGTTIVINCTNLTKIIVDAENTVYDSRNNCNAIIEKNTNELVLGCKNTIIPNSVTSIGNSAFYRCTALTEITIPNSVTSIGDSAFNGCSKLTEITIPNSVTSIGDNAFYYCTGLTEITIPNSVTSIGDSAFRGCIGLTEIIIPSGVTSIGNSAFNGCSKLTEITIPSGVTSIGNEVFSICTGLTSITIPNSVTSIGSSAFYSCTSLTGITIPNSVTSIGSSAFYSCTGLTEITIPNSVTSIGNSAFNYCIGLTEITIPNSVTSIDDNAFFGCTGLTEITIPNSVTSIGSSAFYSCTGLTEITIPNSVTSIGDRAFSSCSKLTTIHYSGTATGAPWGAPNATVVN